MARMRPAYAKLRAQVREHKYQAKIESIMAPGYVKPRLTDEERKATMLRRRLCLKVRTPTDVDWCTINTADAGTTTDAENAQREKLRSMWMNGFRKMYPDGTEWTIKNEYW